jgi:hypothetical protein
MSPEALKNFSGIDLTNPQDTENVAFKIKMIPADVWSFGVLCHNLLFKEFLFKSIDEIHNKEVPDLVFPFNLCASFKLLMQKCLSRDISLRPNFASIVEIVKGVINYHEKYKDMVSDLYQMSSKVQYSPQEENKDDQMDVDYDTEAEPLISDASAYKEASILPNWFEINDF